jgi:hypothetical protein
MGVEMKAAQDPLITIFREAKLRLLKCGDEYIVVMHGFGRDVIQSAYIPKDSSLYAPLSAIADHLAAGDYPELR